MSRYDSSGWPAVEDDTIVDAVEEAAADGWTDQLGGGVHPSALIEYVDGIEDESHLGGRCMDLADEGRLRVVHGVGPGSTRPRTSFLFAGYEEGDDRA